MAYEYYCTECGQKNSAETVLFNMDALLTQDKNKDLKLLHFRMTEAELKALMGKGVEKDGNKECVMTFSELMGYLSSEHSMGIAELKDLTLEDVESFVLSAASSSAKGEDEEMDDNPFGSMLFGMEDMDDEDEEEEENENAKALSPALQKILESSSANMDKSMDESILRDDLQIIYGLFTETRDECYHFTIREHTMADDHGQEFLDGYWVNNRVAVDNARICSRCYKKIFYKAGVAEHRVITFIGETKAGKTSTILSLTHYALYGLCPIGTDQNVQIWMQNGVVADARRFPNITTELLSGDNDKLRDDLEWFKLGVAPAKTEVGARETAYHSTMLITNGVDGRKKILSLMDLPGELFDKETGKVNEAAVCNEYSAALSSSAYLICFDATDTNKINIEDIIHLIGNAQMMQNLRKKQTGEKYYVPSMVLFSKSDAARGELLLEEGHKTQLYMLRGEDAVMKNDPIFKQIQTQFANDPLLKASFYSIMRSGAFGKAAPNTGEVLAALSSNSIFGSEETRIDNKQEIVDKYNALEEPRDRDGNLLPYAEIPLPKQMDLLMQWILHVAGCLPLNQDYSTINVRWSMQNYYMDRLQYRPQNPSGPVNGDIKEGMARQILFCNPGMWDKRVVESLNVPNPRWPIPARTVEGHIEWVRSKMNQGPDTNH